MFDENDCLVLDHCNATDGNLLCDSRGNAYNLDAIVKVWIFLPVKRRRFQNLKSAAIKVLNYSLCQFISYIGTHDILFGLRG